MRNVTVQDVEELKELQSDIVKKLEQFKSICRQVMSPNEYEQFKYNTLGHAEPALSDESEWFTQYSSIKSLESVVNNFIDQTYEDEDENDGESEEA